MSGDLHVVRAFPGGVLVAVIDALGHGREAAQAAQLAAGTLEQQAHEPPQTLLQRCNRVLVGTRGAVMSLASINWAENLMTWIGVGDVAGMLVAADHAPGRRETVLLTRGGIVGRGEPLAARPWIIPLAGGDTLIFATDGVQDEFAPAAVTQHPPQQMADQILNRYRKGTDDALVLVARYPSEGSGP
jgi:serine phosphatase RsbU (regulator of sigma subunit)